MIFYLKDRTIEPKVVAIEGEFININKFWKENQLDDIFDFQAELSREKFILYKLDPKDRKILLIKTELIQEIEIDTNFYLKNEENED